jgi:hypothetical protein
MFYKFEDYQRFVCPLPGSRPDELLEVAYGLLKQIAVGKFEVGSRVPAHPGLAELRQL